MNLSDKLTILSRDDWKANAKKLKAGTYKGVDYSVPFGEAKKYLGIPFWKPNGDPVKSRSEGVQFVPVNKGKSNLQMMTQDEYSARKSRQAKSRQTRTGISQDALQWLADAVKRGDYSSIQEFKRERGISDKELKTALKTFEQATGIKIDDGHLTLSSNNSPEARAPEISRVNQLKSDTQPIPDKEMLRSGLPADIGNGKQKASGDLVDAVNQVAGREFRGVNAVPTIRERTEMLNQGISGDQAVALADRRQQLKLQELPPPEQSKLAIKPNGNPPPGTNGSPQEILAINSNGKPKNGWSQKWSAKLRQQFGSVTFADVSKAVAQGFRNPAAMAIDIAASAAEPYLDQNNRDALNIINTPFVPVQAKAAALTINAGAANAATLTSMKDSAGRLPGDEGYSKR